jgi:hypothetical protein
MRTSTQPECPCAPCIERERALSETFIIEQTPIADKIGKPYTDEFRRLLSIAPQYTFGERIVQLEAFSAADAAGQWAILRRYAVDRDEAACEDCNDAVAEGRLMSNLIMEADRYLAASTLRAETAREMTAG